MTKIFVPMIMIGFLFMLTGIVLPWIISTNQLSLIAIIGLLMAVSMAVILLLFFCFYIIIKKEMK